jgi:hypothetical protein
VKLKLAALWTATVFLFAYGDIFTVYRADKVREILGGKIGDIEVTQAFLLAAGVYVAIPSIMVFLALALPARVSRWVNIAVGAIYAPTIIASAIGEDWAYSIFLSVLEVALVLLIVWSAWNWPRGAGRNERLPEHRGASCMIDRVVDHGPGGVLVRVAGDDEYGPSVARRRRAGERQWPASKKGREQASPPRGAI